MYFKFLKDISNGQPIAIEKLKLDFGVSKYAKSQILFHNFGKKKIKVK